MESLLMQNQPSRQPAMTAFILTIANIALLIAAMGIVALGKSTSDIYSSYAYTRIAMVLLIVLSVAVLIALPVSVLSLFKTIKKPALHGGKGFAITATLVNGFLSIFAVIVLLIVVSALVNGGGL